MAEQEAVKLVSFLVGEVKGCTSFGLLTRDGAILNALPSEVLWKSIGLPSLASASAKTNFGVVII